MIILFTHPTAGGRISGFGAGGWGPSPNNAGLFLDT